MRPRAIEEFAYRGDAAVARPAAGAPADAFFDYVYLRDNPSGRHANGGIIRRGCRRGWWSTRDTRTHEVFAVVTARDFANERNAAEP